METKEHPAPAFDKKYIEEKNKRLVNKNVNWYLNLLMAISVTLISPKRKRNSPNYEFQIPLRLF